MKKIIIIVTLAIAGITANAQYIKVNREVICPDEYAALSTDTMVNAVNIGDIICYNSDGDTIIVTASDWDYYSSIGYTALSVVFFVDSTGQHGWAVKAGTFESKKWNNKNTTRVDVGNVDNYPPTYMALNDLDGVSNSYHICNCANYNNTNYPAIGSIPSSFYLPAIGQLNILYSTSALINPSLNAISNNFSINTSNEFWSSTEGLGTNATSIKYYALSISINGIAENNKTTPLYVLPVMDF